MAISIIGVDMEITMMVNITASVHTITNCRQDGRMVSIVSMSFPNLFMIRPKGVVSKKLMGEAMIFFNNPW